MTAILPQEVPFLRNSSNEVVIQGGKTLHKIFDKMMILDTVSLINLLEMAKRVFGEPSTLERKGNRDIGVR